MFGTTVTSLLRIPADYVDMHLMWQRRRMSEAAPKAQGRLLDVGCGNMPYRDLFRKYVQEYVGIEYDGSYELTDASKRDASTPQPDVLYDGVTLPFDSASFDVVLNIDVLEHTPEPARLVNEMARVLRPGGTLILTAPFSFRLHEEPHDYFRYTPHGLRSLCESAGCDVFEVAPYGSLASLLAHKINSFLLVEAASCKSIGQAIGKLGHEETNVAPVRWWLLPVVAPLALAAATGARLVDALPRSNPSETLGFMILARRRS